MLSLTLRSTHTGDVPSLYGLVQSLTPLSDTALSQTWVFAGSAATGVLSSYRIDGGPSLPVPDQTMVSSAAPVFRISDVAVSSGPSPYLFTAALGVTQITSYSVSATGDLTAPKSFTSALQAGVSALDLIETGGKTFVITGHRDTPDVFVYEWGQSGQLTYRSAVEDLPKTALGGTSDITVITTGGGEFVVVGSVHDNSISTLSIAADGSSEVVDTIGQKDGMWVSGLDGVAQVTAYGDSFLVAAGVTSSSLTLVRVNDIGVMFAHDHRIDDLNSRFAQVDAVTAFEFQGRGFIVAGGGG